MTSRDCCYDAFSVVSSAHGRQRRDERQIDKQDFKLARRYGMKEKANDDDDDDDHNGRRSCCCWKYTYKGFVFVVNTSENKEITSYISKDWASPFSGTRCTLPVLLPMEKEYLKRERIDEHKRLRKQIMLRLKQKQDRWCKRHTVCIVDMSHSMRVDDINGARCRSDAVWAAMARAIHSELDLERHDGTNKTKNGNDPLDSVSVELVSIVLMKSDDAIVHLKYEPVDFVLYNRFVDLCEFSTCRPVGKANYKAALKEAVHLLKESSGTTTTTSCQFSLLLIGNSTFDSSSDCHYLTRNEKRSIEKEIVDSLTTEIIASSSTLAPRLVVGCLGLGHESDDFTFFQNLVHECSRQQRVKLARLVRVTSLDLDSLTNAMTDLLFKSHLQLGQDVDEKEVSGPLCISSSIKVCVVSKIWAWNVDVNDFSLVTDRRCQSCYAIVGDENFRADPNVGWLCASCECTFFCLDCMNQFTWHLGSQECKSLASKRQSGHIVRVSSVPSYSVGIDKAVSASESVFSGHKLRFLDKNRQIVGRGMRCIQLGDSGWKEVHEGLAKHYQDYCRTKALTSHLSEKFNAALDQVQAGADISAFSHPPVSFLRVSVARPLILELEGSGCCLVEEDMPMHPVSELESKEIESGQSLDNIPSIVGNGWENGVSCNPLVELASGDDGRIASPDVCEILEAFRHFSYDMSNRIRLVDPVKVNLRRRSDGKMELVLGHATLHERTKASSRVLDKFLHSHECNSICFRFGLRRKYGG